MLATTGFPADPASDGFIEQITAIRERVKQIPDEYFVVLVGAMITEDALPTYQTMVNRPEGAQDETGASLTPWSIWTRSWTAEENRHGDLLNKCLYFSGRGDDTGIGKDPYLLAIYTSFQERGTAIYHGNMGRLPKEKGDLKLAKICGTIAADEMRHETAYTKLVGKLFEIDPNGTVQALAHMMWRKISMPGELMYDGATTTFSCTSHLLKKVLGFTLSAIILIYWMSWWRSGKSRISLDFQLKGRKLRNLCVIICLRNLEGWRRGLKEEPRKTDYSVYLDLQQSSLTR
ncbi:hypothetical protein SLE2022_220910 [Rubroshorea leprosula]